MVEPADDGEAEYPVLEGPGRFFLHDDHGLGWLSEVGVATVAAQLVVVLELLGKAS